MPGRSSFGLAWSPGDDRRSIGEPSSLRLGGSERGAKAQGVNPGPWSDWSPGGGVQDPALRGQRRGHRALFVESPDCHCPSRASAQLASTTS